MILSDHVAPCTGFALHHAACAAAEVPGIGNRSDADVVQAREEESAGNGCVAQILHVQFQLHFVHIGACG